MSLAEVAALGSLVGIAYGLLMVGGWIPLVPPILALVATGGTVVVSIAHQMQQQQEKVAQLAQQQEQTIALLTTMVKKETKKVGVGEWETTDNALTVPMPNFAEATRAAIASFSSPHPAIPAPNDSLDGRYQIVSILGKGGFGQTYLAQDTKRPGNPICVVKYLMPARRDVKFLEVARRLFETEAKILEALGRHSQIPQLLAYFEANEEFYLVEEYIEGYPLSDVLFADKRLSEVQVVDILAGVLEVLAFIHKHHVIHRDIKPSNIIRSKQDGMLVLIDFGAVKQMHPQLDGETENQTVAIGTRGYAPAEQYAGHPRLNSDIYALGMIAIQALTGILPQQLPQDRDTGNVVWRDLANVNEELAQIINKMVQYHFSDRYQSAAEVLQGLNHLDRATLSTQPSDLRKIPDSSQSERLNLSDGSDVSDSTVQDHRD
jgi:serine/threonine protein kinase/xanthosine utilization system XapX-like protein